MFIPTILRLTDQGKAFSGITKMIMLFKKLRRNARPFTLVDTAGWTPILSRIGQGFLKRGRRKVVSKLVQSEFTRACILNISIFIGQSSRRDG